MGQYCDSKVLEHNWFLWLLASRVPDLEAQRANRLLWTKVIGNVTIDGKQPLKYGKPLADPSYPVRQHCLALAHPVYFQSENGHVPESGTVTIDGRQRTIELSSVFAEINLLSDSFLHDLDNPFKQSAIIIPELMSQNYIHERPASNTWHSMLTDIGNMCSGIAMKFKLPEDEATDLSNEALLQVMHKLKNNRLVYTPGRASVFNLLTTTIHRCMFSIMNRKRNKRNGFNKLVADMQAGVLPDNMRSLRLPNVKRSASV